METSVHGITAPSAVYEIGGQRFEITAPGFAEAIANAYASHLRPRCMCLVEGLEMYVARLGDGYIVKRMPETGSHHAPDCSSYEPPAEFSGLGQLLSSAITEDPTTGETTLKLGFPLSKMPGRLQTSPSVTENDSVATDGTKLSLRGLLHYLWDQAELTRWHPGFAGKRSWATVRRHLLQAAGHKIARGQALQSRLYVPEAFSVEQRDAINARRLAQLAHVMASPGSPQQLMLMIAELKEIVPARYGYKAIVKHVPDQAFAVDELLYRRLGRHFDAELAMWGASDKVRMVMIATFEVSTAGLPTIMEMSLMPVTPHWLPVESAFEFQLIDTLVREGRAFRRGLRYSLDPAQLVASAILTDTGPSPYPLCICSELRSEDSEGGMLAMWPSAWYGERSVAKCRRCLPGNPPASLRLDYAALQTPRLHEHVCYPAKSGRSLGNAGRPLQTDCCHSGLRRLTSAHPRADVPPRRPGARRPQCSCRNQLGFPTLSRHRICDVMCCDSKRQADSPCRVPTIQHIGGDHRRLDRSARTGRRSTPPA